MPGTTTPDNIPFPLPGEEVANLDEWLEDNAQATQVALNKLTSKHAEFTASKSALASGARVPAGVFTRDVDLSTTATMVTAGADGQLIINETGLYAISVLTRSRNANNTDNSMTGRGFVDLSTLNTEAGLLARESINVGEATASPTIPNLRVLTAGSALWLAIYRTVASTAGNVDTRVRITKVGRI